MFGRFVDWILVIGGLIGLAATCFWALYGGPTSASALEMRLQDRAQAALHMQGYDWASVEMEGQKAVLSGVAPAQDSLAGAVSAVISSSGFGGYVYGGVTVVSEAVAAAPPISPYVWSATRTEEGRILLNGYVPSREILDAILDDAEAIAPGEVDNFLQLGSGEPLGDWVNTARKGLMQLDLLTQGEAHLVDSRLTVSGIAPDDAIRERVKTDVERVSAPYSGAVDIRGASLWSAKRIGETLIFSGQVQNSAERNEINAIANEYFDGNIQDNMTVATHGYRDWIEGVRLGLPHFARFQSGKMAFDPQGEGYRFQGKASDSVLTYLEEDLSNLESQYGVELKAERVDVAVSEIDGIDFSGDIGAACQSAFEAILASNTVTFESGSATISRESGQTLDKLISVARRCGDLFLQVQGHTDSNGDRSFNIRLSEQRAAAVVAYLVARGLPEDKLDPVGFGPDQPIVSNATRDGRAANRRIEFNVIERG